MCSPPAEPRPIRGDHRTDSPPPQHQQHQLSSSSCVGVDLSRCGSRFPGLSHTPVRLSHGRMQRLFILHGRYTPAQPKWQQKYLPQEELLSQALLCQGHPSAIDAFENVHKSRIQEGPHSQRRHNKNNNKRFQQKLCFSDT